MGDRSRELLAKLTFFAEAATLALTLLYTALVLSDINLGHARLTCAEWFREGFCVWRDHSYLTSHSLCFGFDVPVGIALAAMNGRLLVSCKQRDAKVGFLIMLVASLFCVLHGIAHLTIDILGPGFQLEVHPSKTSWLGFAASFSGTAAFLAIGPVVGVLFGVPLALAIPLHLAMSFGMLCIPQQFAFAGVQLIINLWYCAPRLLWIGAGNDTAISKRIDNGFAVNSIGNLMLMPVVFAEALACESFYRRLSGHLLYDSSILVVVAVNTVLLWNQGTHLKEA
eukprot:TRINITY_DN12685_c1_g1_i1.p1 TRINITY_DN12685_c1_g1~~TRINITY_DN12685_c1_g1_i1.p1  ORF type:complete len:282 (-),score=26.50 TRINITY_DN12685_c1_g1_i1:231-1076(-)